MTPDEYEDAIVKACADWLRGVLSARVAFRPSFDLDTLLVELEAGGWRTKLPFRLEGEIPMPDVREARLWDCFEEVDKAAGPFAYSPRPYATVAERRRLKAAVERYRLLRDEIAMVDDSLWADRVEPHPPTRQVPET